MIWSKSNGRKRNLSEQSLQRIRYKVFLTSTCGSSLLKSNGTFKHNIVLQRISLAWFVTGLDTTTRRPGNAQYTLQLHDNYFFV